MQTSTNILLNMHPFLPARGKEAHSVLQSGGLVLLPTANLWQTVSLPQFPQTHQRQLRLTPPTAGVRPELLFPDLEMLRAWFPAIHPKIETLLLFHKRPLTVLLPAHRRIPATLVNEQGEMAVRLIGDSYVYGLAEDLDQPLVATIARAAGSPFLPLNFGRIRSDVLQGVDHVVRRRQKDRIGDAPAVVIRLNAEDEVEFL